MDEVYLREIGIIHREMKNYMKIEILNEEGFASVKEVRFEHADDNESFTTPAAVFVPFLHDEKRMDGASSLGNKDIFEKVPSAELRNRAREMGMRTLREDGLRKAAAGVTTVEEVLRVTMGDLD